MVNVTPADVSDRAGAQTILDAIRKRWPWLKHLLADAGYDRATLLDKGASPIGNSQTDPDIIRRYAVSEVALAPVWPLALGRVLPRESRPGGRLAARLPRRGWLAASG